MQFHIDTADALKINDQELLELLTRVYVDEGFVEPEIATTLFEPTAVRERGIIIGARDIQTSILAGMIIIVPPESEACRMAKANEVEFHLLGVSNSFRKLGLGHMLVKSAMDYARKCNYKKIILWTQTSMYAAQKLYESMEFIRGDKFNRNGRDFILYEKLLNPI